jgi:hypothetical protein
MRVGGRRFAASGSEFDCFRLAHDERAGGAQHSDAGRILAGPVAPVERRIVLRWQVSGVDHILDADRYAVQRANRAVAGKMAVELPRLGNGAVRVQRGPGPHDGFPLLDPSEAVAH